MGLIGHSAGESTVVKVAVTADGTPIRDDHFDTAAGDRMAEYVPASKLAGAVSALEEARALIETAEQDGYVSAGWREDARSWAATWADTFGGQ